MPPKEEPQTEEDRAIEVWKVKKLIQNLSAARGFVFSFFPIQNLYS